jgi:putative methyltransferase (TIGR04325 family)
MPLTLDSIRDFPPIRALREARFEREFLNSEAQGCFRGVYATFAEAEADLPSGVPIGFDQPGLGELYQELFTELREWEYPVLYWLSRLMPTVRSVFDFGGHVGILYYAFSRYLDFDEGFRWTVLDVPEVRRRGIELAAERGASQLAFAEQLEAVDGHALLLSSGSQQYLEELIFERVDDVAEPPNELILNQIPLHDEIEFVTLQSVKRSFCPYKVFHRERFLDELGRLGWEIRDRWVNPGKTCHVMYRPETHSTRYHGFYCTRRQPA